MTLSELYTQQVLNNLAMFVQNPDALPFFAFPNQGTTSIQDTGNIGNPGYESSRFMSSAFVLNGARQTTENWVLVPVSDPAKLGLMRCAYRQAIASCIGVDLTHAGCPSCRDLRKDFHGPPDPAAKNPQENEELPCLDSACWLRWSCKKHLPKKGDSRYVGRYGDLYVWIPPGGREMLTRLTMAILDYAVNDAVQYEKRTKQVEIWVDDTGEVVNEVNEAGDPRTGVRKITATIPIDFASGNLAILDTYGEFLRKFPAGTKQRLLDRGKAFGASDEDLDNLEYWEDLPLDAFASGFVVVSGVRKQLLPPDESLREPARWIKKHNVIPRDIPDDDELLRGPALYQRKGSASAGLQAYEQRLTAASGAPPK